MKIRYTNENLRAQVKKNMMLLKFFIVSFIVSILLIASSPVITYIQMVNKYPIPFDKIKNASHFPTYYAKLDELPSRLGDNSDFYLAKIDGHKFVLKMYSGLYGNVMREFAENGTAWVHGTLNAVDKDETTLSVFVDNNYKYLDCFDYSFFNEMRLVHPIGMVFGITWLIVSGIGMNMFGTLNMLKHWRPACGRPRYSIKEIDEQANTPDAEWLAYYGIYLAPKIMIGTQKGMTAVSYGDVKRVSIKAKLHVESHRPRRRHPHYFEFETFQIIVRTKSGRRLKFCDVKTVYDRDFKKICDRILEHSPDAEIVNNKD